MAANATGGSGGQSAYNSQVATLKENSETGVQPFVEVTYTSATQGGGPVSYTHLRAHET